MVLVGSAAFCALGLALSGAIPNADATAPIVNAVALPVEFLSGIFIAFGNTTPSWILWIARVFPVRHFALGMQAGILGTPFSWTDVLVVAAWGVGGMLVAIRFFHWEPRQASAGRREATEDLWPLVTALTGGLAEKWREGPEETRSNGPAQRPEPRTAQSESARSGDEPLPPFRVPGQAFRTVKGFGPGLSGRSVVGRKPVTEWT